MQSAQQRQHYAEQQLAQMAEQLEAFERDQADLEAKLAAVTESLSSETSRLQSLTAELQQHREQIEQRQQAFRDGQLQLNKTHQEIEQNKAAVLDLMRKRGYRFISLGDALGDQAYSLPDTFVGEEGTGWIEHWAITLGKPPQGAPVFPQWVIERSKALRLPQP